MLSASLFLLTIHLAIVSAYPNEKARLQQPAPTNVTRCDAVGYKNLTCQNNGTCYGIEEGITWNYYCVCDDAYSGDTCQYRGRPLQTFQLPSPKPDYADAQTIVGDSKNIYTIVNCDLVSYQLNSNGLLAGDSYINSVNSSVLLGNYCRNYGVTASALRDNIFTFVNAYPPGPQPTMSIAGTNPLQSVTTSNTLTFIPGGLAFDKYDYIWVNDNIYNVNTVSVFNSLNGRLAASLLKSGIAGTKGSSGFGITVTDDDVLYMTDSAFGVAVYQIERDANHIPIQINLINSITTSNGCFPQGMTYDRWGQVLATCDDVVNIIKADGTVEVINGYTAAENSPWKAIWSSPVSGYLYLASCCTNEFYVQQYMSY